MNSSKRSLLFVSACLAALGAQGTMASALAPEGEAKAELTLIPKGAMPKIGYYMPQRLSLSASKPANIKKEPAYKHTAMYGAIPFGEDGRKVALVLDEAADASAASIYLDANNDGDLTNDVPVTWERSAKKAANAAAETVMFQGGGAVAAKDGAENADWLGLKLYRFSPETAKSRKLETDLILYYRDYARSGKITLGGKEYPILLVDERAAGQYGMVEHGEKEQAKVRLLIDRNGNKRFENKFEQFDLAKPFNIGGKTYEVALVSPDGANLTLKKSNKEVAEIPLPADLSIGKNALEFTRPVIGGKTVNFPGDFKGKIVLLDFWATWCGPCLAELPGLIAAYEKYHSKGFEILGISLDQPNQLEKVQTFLKEKKMGWDQVYDGKFWQAEIGQLYSVDSIPRAFLVNGSTGKIIALTGELRGAALEKTLEKALESLNKSASSE